jgi:signal transduction histidine kinase
MQAGPWFRSIRAQLSVTFALVSMLSIAIVGAPLYWLAQRLLSSSLRERLESTVELSALSLSTQDLGLSPGDEETPHYQSLVGLLQELQEEAGLTEVFIVDTSGRFLVSLQSNEKIGAPAASLIRDNVRLSEALTQDVTFSALYESAAHRPLQAAYAPIDLDHDERGEALLGVVAPAQYVESLSNFSRLFLLAGLALFVLIFFLGSLAAAWVTGPLRRLVIAVGKLEQGFYTEPLPQAGSLELAILQDEFHQMALAVKQREAWLRGLAGAVAHEVRNPTNALRLHLGLLQRSLARSPTPEELQQRFTTLEGDLSLLEETVSHFLAFANRGEVQRRPTQLRALLAKVFDGEIEAPEVEVQLDPVLVEQALANLLRNAHQAGASQIQIRAFVGAEDQAVHIQVQDNGAGFPPELTDKAFEPFVTGRPEGSGIGLAIVAAISRAHHGEATIVQTGPTGTLIEISLREK